MSDEQRAKAYTPYPDLNRVLGEMVRSVQAILGENFVGAYLQGSFAVGDFDLHSDVDFAIVMERELSEGQVAALQATHERIYGMNSRWAKHLEGSYFPIEVFRHGTTRGCDLWYLDNGARSLIRSDHCNTLVVRFVVREQGIILAGVDPQHLIDPINPDALRHEIYETMTLVSGLLVTEREMWNNRFYQAYLVLNFCRMMHDLHRGQVGSKLAGCEWMIYHFAPQWAALIDRSWARRANPANWIGLPADEADFNATLDFVQFIMEQSQAFMVAHAG